MFYLFKFNNSKKSKELIEICSGLILNAKDDSSAFLGAHFLYLYIQENIDQIIQSTEKYLQIKNMLLNNLIHKCHQFSLIAIKRLCYSISIILAVGSLTINTNFIQEIIEFGKSSITNCYISVVILNSVYFEFGKLTLNDKTIKSTITFNLKEKMPDVLEFMNFLLENFNLNEQNNNNNGHIKNESENSNNRITFEEIKSEIFDLIQSLVKLDVNILFNPKIFHTLMNSFNVKNAEKISFILVECINCLSSAELHLKTINYNVKLLNESIECEHFQILEGLVIFLNNYIKEKIDLNSLYHHKNFNVSNNLEENPSTINHSSSKKLDSDKIEILAALAYLYGSIVRNYVFFFFLDNELSQMINENLIFFLSCKNLKISAKMFEPLDEICSFLKESQFEDYPENIAFYSNKTADQMKNEISLFLINITGLIMFNCKLNQIYIPILKKQAIISTLNQLELEEENEWDSDDSNFLSVTEYRVQAKEAYFDIFSVYVQNLKEDGVKIFLDYLNDIIDNNNLLNPFNSKKNANEISEKEKKEKVNLIEVVLLLLKSIEIDLILDPKYGELLLHITLKIFSTQVIYDEFILCSLLQLLDQIPEFINQNKKLFKNTLELFALTMKNKQFQLISSQAIELISEYCKEPQEEIFQMFYKTYLDSFDIYESNSLSVLATALLKFVWIHADNQTKIGKLSDEQLLYFVELILTPVTGSIRKIKEFISSPDILASLNADLNDDNEIIKHLKKTIRKNLSIYSSIFYLKNKSSYVLLKIYLLFYQEFKEILEFCYNHQKVDCQLRDEIHKVVGGILFAIEDLNQTNQTLDMSILSDSFINLHTILAFSFIRHPDYNIFLSLFNRFTEFLCFNSAVDEKENLFRNCLLIIEKTQDESKNFQTIAFSENFPPEYLKLWIIIFRSGMQRIFFDLVKFNNFIELLLRMLFCYSQQESDCSNIFYLMDNLVAFFSGFIEHSKVFPKEFYEDKANKIIKAIMAALNDFNDSDIFKVFINFLSI